MTTEGQMRIGATVAALVVALGTVALTLAQWFYWDDGGAAFATFIAGAFIAAFLKPE